MNQHAFKDIKTPAQIESPKSSRFIRMRKRTLQVLTPSTQQPSASRSPNPPSICVDSFTGGGIILPVSAAAGGLGNISANSEHPQILKQLVTVIALVRNHLPNPIGLGFYLLDVVGRLIHRFFNRFGVALISWLNRQSHHSARLEIDRMLGFMSQMRAAIFHLGNACIGIVWMGPVVIRSFLWPFAIQARQIFSRRRLDARGLRQSYEKRLVTLTRVAPHNATQGSIRFQRRGVHSHRLAVNQSRLRKSLQNPAEHSSMRLDVDQPPGSRNRRMVVGWRLSQLQPQKRSHAERVRRAPSNPSFRFDLFEKSQHQQSE